MKVRTQDLTDKALDWAVASYADKHVTRKDIHWGNYSPPTSWAQGGPIIERAVITLTPLFFMGGGWRANHHNLRYDDMGEYINGSDGMQDGPTPLIAAMRCLVASKLGDEVDIPEEML